MTKAKLGKHAAHVAAWLQSPLVILVSLALSMGALAFAVEANGKSSAQASSQAVTAQAQNENLRRTFCGLVEPLAAQDPAQVKTLLGGSLIAEAKRTTTRLGCTSDPTDHQ
jgi:hypothetical protein